MSHIEVETVAGIAAVPGLAAALHQLLDPATRERMPVEAFAGQFDQDTVVIARRDGQIVGWTQMGHASSAGEPGVPPGHQVFPLAIDDAPETYLAMLRAAAAAAGANGIGWHVATGDLHEQVATRLGARLHEEVATIWQAPLTGRPTPALPPDLAILPLDGAPPASLLAAYADLMGRAGIEFCTEDYCSTTWTADDVAMALDWRTRDQHVHVLMHGDRMLADLAADLVGDEVQVDLVQHDAPVQGLAAALAGLLDAAASDASGARLATLQLPSAEPAEVAQALSLAGFTQTARGVTYHLTVDATG